MTYREDFTLPAELLEQVSTQGFDVLPELIRIVVNAAMQAERQQHLTNGHQSEKHMLMDTSPRRSRPGLGTLLSQYHRSGKVISTRKRWRRGCVANVP
jgi:hypothetical protein